MKFSNHLPPKILILLFLIFPFVIGGKERGSPRSVLERKALATKYVRIILASNAPPFHLEKLEKDYPIQKTQKGQDDHISTGLLNHGSHSNRKRQRQSEPDENIKKPKASVDNEQWIIKSASGGLVTAVEPVIKANKENVWVFHVTPSDPEYISTPEKDPKLMAIEAYKNSEKSTFGLSPVLIDIENFDKFYKGMSNNILWPAFHNILHKIVVKNEDFNTNLEGM
ncbi:unnamed protein product [Meloidogyne enterolobii]|uniref:Uncharacterized protein n=1 Tax=Meloidogyne enterolobii TaxID=390850 RepID=A0ACB1B8M7_MELEN